MNTIILAGGYACRMSPTTDEAPKPLLPVVGRPVLAYTLDSLGDMYRRVDGGSCYLAINEKFEKDFRNFLKDYRADFNIELIVEDSNSNSRKKGSARAVHAAIEQNGISCHDGLLVTADDTLSSLSFYDFLIAYNNDPDAVLTPLWDVNDLGKARCFTTVTAGLMEAYDFGLEVRVLDEILEKPAEARSSMITLATYIYSPEAAGYLNEFLNDGDNNDFIGTFLPWLKSKHGVVIKGMQFDGYWFDVGSHESFAEANRFLRRLGGVEVGGKNA